MTYTEIVNKLVGNIEPVGDSHIDEKRFENLKNNVRISKQLSS